MSNETKTETLIIDESLYYLKPSEQVDLTNCDREPIHIIRHVQPHGALLALSPDNLTIAQVSANSREFFGISAEDLIGQGAESLFAPDQVEELLPFSFRCRFAFHISFSSFRAGDSRSTGTAACGFL